MKISKTGNQYSEILDKLAQFREEEPPYDEWQKNEKLVGSEGPYDTGVSDEATAAATEIVSLDGIRPHINPEVRGHMISHIARLIDRNMKQEEETPNDLEVDPNIDATIQRRLGEY